MSFEDNSILALVVILFSRIEQFGSVVKMEMSVKDISILAMEAILFDGAEQFM